MSVYEELKDIKNVNPKLLKYFKKNPYAQIWGFCDPANGKFITRKALAKLNLRDLYIFIGCPTSFGYRDNTRGDLVVKRRAYTGVELENQMKPWRSGGLRTLVGIGSVSRGGVWMKNITELFIQKYKELGDCAVSNHHHDYELVSPKVKKCIRCGSKLKSKIQTVKTVEWEVA